MIGLSTVVLYSAVVLAVGYFLYRAALPKPIPGIPYNEAAAKHVLGDAPGLLEALTKTGTMLDWLVSQLVNRNEPVMQLFLRPLGKPFVVISDFRETQDICVRRSREFDRSNYFGDIFVAILPEHHVHMPTAETWKMHRKLMADTMSQAFLSNAAGPQMHKNALALIKLWREKASLARGHPFTAIEDVKAAAMDIIWGATFGSQMNACDTQTALLSSLEHIEQPADAESEIVFPRAPEPESFSAIMTICDSVTIAIKSLFPRFEHRWSMRLIPKFRKATAHKDQLIQEGLQRAWQKFSVAADDDDAVKCALDLVVQREAQIAKKEGRVPEWDTADIRDELFGFLVAGHDTSSTSLLWAFKRLSDNQHVQEKLRAALRSAYPRAVTAGELPTAKEISTTRISYLDAVIEEIHRISGAVAIIMRVATVDTEVLGHHIPKGTDVFMLTQGPGFVKPSIPIDEKVRSTSSRESKDKNGAWDEASIHEFDPERWLEKDGEGNVAFNSRAGPTMPFGAGPRGCFGRKLAELELRILITLIFMNFKLDKTPTELSGYGAHDVITHTPWKCYVKLTELE